MKCVKVCLLVALATMLGQTTVWGQTTSRGIKGIPMSLQFEHFGQRNDSVFAPTTGAAYGILPGLVAENPIDGSISAVLGALGGDPATMAVNDAIMDGKREVIGTDLSFVLGNPAPDLVESFESLEVLGMDPNGSGRFLLRLTVGFETTSTALVWDTLSVDNQDPFDVDGNGITGKGPDGIYFTADDIFEGDGFFDTGDGTLNETFPLDPPVFVLPVDLDGDGDTANDPPSVIVGQGIFLGDNANMAPPITFDPAGGPVTVTAASWELRDSNGDIADIDGDGIADGPFAFVVEGDGAFAVFTEAADGGWSGSFGFAFPTDGNVCNELDTINGNVKSSRLVFEYLSDIEPVEFGDPGTTPMDGCAAPASFTRFRGTDLGTAAVGDFATEDGAFASYIPGFVIGAFEAPVWLIFEYDAAAAGSVEVISNAGTPGLEMTVEYSLDNGATYTAFGTATESFNATTTNTFDLGGVSSDFIRVGWRRVGFTINFPWQVNVDAVNLCQ